MERRKRRGWLRGVAVALARALLGGARPRGSYRREPLPSRADSPLGAADRATSTLADSFAPNRFVVLAEPDLDAALAHELVSPRGRKEEEGS